MTTINDINIRHSTNHKIHIIKSNAQVHNNHNDINIRHSTNHKINIIKSNAQIHNNHKLHQHTTHCVP